MKNYLLTLPKSFIISLLILIVFQFDMTIKHTLLLTFFVNGYLFPIPPKVNDYIENLAHGLARAIYVR